MMKKKQLTLFIFLLLFLAGTFSTYAENPGYSLANIEGSHVVKNNESLKDGRFTFVLTSIDSAPMPEGAVSGVKKVTIGPNETFKFGSIKYSKPGTYKYRISREIIKSKNLKQDSSEYKCNITVFSDGNTVIVFQEKGKSGKPNKIEYTDTYIEKSSNDKFLHNDVKTGDDKTLLIYITVFLSIIILMIGKKQNKDN